MTPSCREQLVAHVNILLYFGKFILTPASIDSHVSQMILSWFLLFFFFVLTMAPFQRGSSAVVRGCSVDGFEWWIRHSEGWDWSVLKNEISMDEFYTRMSKIDQWDYTIYWEALSS